MYNLRFEISNLKLPAVSTIVEDPLQIGPFMQNKANVKIGKMGTERQRHIVNFTPRPSSIIPHPVCLSASAPLNLTKPGGFVILFMQNKANFERGQMNVKSFQTTDYDDFCRFEPGKNKANSNPNKANFKRYPVKMGNNE